MRWGPISGESWWQHRCLERWLRLTWSLCIRRDLCCLNSAPFKLETPDPSSLAVRSWTRTMESVAWIHWNTRGNTLPQSVERTRYSPNIIRSSKLFKLVPGTRRTPNREGSKVLSHLDYHFSRIDWRFHLLLDLSIGSQFLVLLAFILELNWRFFKLDFDFRSGLPDYRL